MKKIFNKLLKFLKRKQMTREEFENIILNNIKSKSGLGLKEFHFEEVEIWKS